MRKSDAIETLSLCGIPPGADFHTLGSCAVERLLERADAWRYRKPHNANGSRARYFYAHLERVAAKGVDA